MSGNIIFAQALHRDDDAAGPLVIQPTEQGALEPVIDPFPIGI